MGRSSIACRRRALEGRRIGLVRSPQRSSSSPSTASSVYGAPAQASGAARVVDRVANEMIAGHVMEGSRVVIDMDIMEATLHGGKPQGRRRQPRRRGGRRRHEVPEVWPAPQPTAP
ncbi:MAG: hypothetical protein ACLT98_09920 [Eggerthellaceae bacterium]